MKTTLLAGLQIRHSDGTSASQTKHIDTSHMVCLWEGVNQRVVKKLTVITSNVHLPSVFGRKNGVAV